MSELLVRRRFSKLKQKWYTRLQGYGTPYHAKVSLHAPVENACKNNIVTYVTELTSCYISKHMAFQLNSPILSTGSKDWKSRAEEAPWQPPVSAGWSGLSHVFSLQLTSGVSLRICNHLWLAGYKTQSTMPWSAETLFLFIQKCWSFQQKNWDDKNVFLVDIHFSCLC